MAPLENAKHEAFARAVLSGKSGTDAYLEIYGGGAKSARAHASRLVANGSVAARIAELKELAADKSVMTSRQVLQELTKLARANMADYVGDDDITLPVQSLTREQAAAIQEHTVEYYTEGHGDDARQVKRVKFKLADKRGALVDLGRHHKLFTDKTEHTGKDGGPMEIRPVINMTGKPDPKDA